MHRLRFADPHRLCTVFMGFEGEINGHKGGRAMVLRPVKLNPTGDPRSQQPHQRRFNDFIVINKIALFHFIPRAMHPTAQFRQDHHFDVVVFQPHRLPGFQGFLLAQRIGHAVGINRAGRSLINAIFQEHGMYILRPGFIGRDLNALLPHFYWSHGALNINKTY
ncbi:hypothetical protein MS6204_03471 [Escherichia coli]|nr:hypothetical protein [Escherichia coli]